MVKEASPLEIERNIGNFAYPETHTHDAGVGLTVALIIAITKGSMVASVFMHLSHEKKWIYGALILTVIGFVLVMCLPVFTVMDA